MATKNEEFAPGIELCRRISVEDAGKRLAERIKIGAEFKTRPIESKKDLKELRNEYYKWNDYNVELLRQSFTNNYLADEYSREPDLRIVHYIGDEIRYFYSDVDCKLHRLESISEKLKLIPLRKEISNHDIFIVHGHDDIAKLELKNYLQNTLKLPEPTILHEKPNHGQSIIEKFEEYANDATLVFVLLTPDDALMVENGGKEEIYRARQNVIFEMGYFLGQFGRKEGRVILLYKKPLEIPSDIAGIVYIPITNGIVAAGEDIRKELLRLGFLSSKT